MRSNFTTRFLFTLTVFATLSMICTESYARGRGGGGGRSGGGRASAGGGRAGAGGGRATEGRGNLSSRGGDQGLRLGGGVSKPGDQSGKLGDRSGRAGDLSRPGNLSSRPGNLGSGLADRGQLQGLLGRQNGQLGNQFSQQKGQFQQSAQGRASQFQSGSQPFTASWYAAHPNAWQATHPNAGLAVVASTAAVAAWVGTGYYPPASSGGSTTIIYEEAPEVATTESAAPAPVLTNVAPAEAAQPTHVEDWLPVGIYTLATSKDTPALLMLQLVVDHQGTLRGVYYDSITDTSHNIVGKLNPSTQVAQWRLESSDQVTFQAPLDELTRSAGTLQVSMPSGPQRWLLARVEN